MIKFIKCRDVKSPERWYSTSSWIDFFIPEDLTSIKITPQYAWSFWYRTFDSNWIMFVAAWEWLMIPSWIKTIIKPWFDMVLENKSWVAVKQWLVIWAKVIDSEYRWEIHLHIINTSNTFQMLKLWQKITQWIVRKVELIDMEEITEKEFNEDTTERWQGGFWSTWT